MDISGSTKFLCNQNEDQLLPINSKFSGIFNKSLFAEKFVENNNERIIPKNDEEKAKDLKELSLMDYFKSLQLLQNINDKHLKILKRISADVSPSENGYLTMKTSSKNTLENVFYYKNGPHETSKLLNYHIIDPLSLGLEEKNSLLQNFELLPPKRKVGRPRNEDKKMMQNYNNMCSVPLAQDVLIHRTKYGRSIKFNSDVAKMLQIDKNSHVLHNNPPDLLTDNVLTRPVDTLEEVDRPKKKRIISSEFRCATCKKVYLGKNKMNHHLKLNPSHRVLALESDLFSTLMKLVRQKKTNQDKADLFFKELSSFVQQCEKFTPQLITNNEKRNVLHHVIDKNSASVLRINPGEYKINMDAFEKPFSIDNQPDNHQETEEVNHVSIEEEPHDVDRVAPGNEVIKVLDDVPSLDGNLLLIPQSTELTHLTNISDIDIITNSEHEGDNALLGFLH